MPVFRYHPDPVATGSAVASDDPCSLCGRPAGLRYEGPVYAGDDEPAVVCLDCIAAGRVEADLTDIDQDGSWDAVPEAVVDEVLHRTPGFTSWQGERWQAHCDDACAYLGTDDGGDEGATTYRFRCLTCGEERTYTDTP